MPDSEVLVTIVTCTYNRSHTLPNVYDSLKRQDFHSFEWIVVDDGSTDNTAAIVKKWANEADFDIVYMYQENNGKHIATNLAHKHARGKYIVNIDSDDEMLPNALSTFINAWNSIQPSDRNNYMSVKARCYDPSTMTAIGKSIPGGKMSCSYLDAKYKHKIQDEMWSMARTAVLKEYPNPDIRGGKAGGGLRFYPEGIWQDLASRKYLTLFIDDPIRGYTQDTSTSLMGRGAKYDRAPENIYLWTHIINDNLDYFRYDPKSFFKAAAGISMDGFFLHKSIHEIIHLGKSFGKRLFIVIMLPVGYICYLKRK